MDEQKIQARRRQQDEEATAKRASILGLRIWMLVSWKMIFRS